MFGRVSRYDEHPQERSAYPEVLVDTLYPRDLPLASEYSEVTPWKIIAPISLLFFTVTLSAHLYFGSMFLGWFIHALYFSVLGFIVYHLCPPQLHERIEINETEVVFERLSVSGYRVEHIPIRQYRGVVPITYRGVSHDGQPYQEFGVALRHADPRKTLILTLHRLKHDDLVEHYAQLFNLKPLFEERFILHLKGKRSRWRGQRNGAQLSPESAEIDSERS